VGLPRRRDLRLPGQPEELLLSLAPVGGVVGQQVVEQGPQAEHIGGRAQAALPARLLRRHVRERPADDVVLGRGDLLPGLGQAGHPEVDQPGPAGGIDEHVGRLEVAVVDAPLVELSQDRGQVGRQGDGLLPGQLLALEHLRQGAAGHVLHHDEGPPVVEVGVVDLDQPRVVQADQDPCLVEQLLADLLRHAPPGPLDDDVLPQQWVDGPEHLPPGRRRPAARSPGTGS
jgi:hypothetical protein